MNYSSPNLSSNLFRCLILAFTIAVFTPIYSTGQCVTPPAQPTCSGIELVDNETLSTGTTRVVTGTSNFNSIIINGGTLIVCGTLNLTSLTFNSGTIIVVQGGNLNVNMAVAVVFGANCTLYNYGSVYFASSIVTGSNNLIVNCLISSYFNIPFNQFVIEGPNTQFVNYGTFNSSYFIVQTSNSANPVCSGPGSVIITGTMINQLVDAFSSPDGASCIQITNQVFNSQPMTASSLVNICWQGNSASGLNFGNATVTLNCVSCSIPLPVDQIQLNGMCMNNQIDLHWTTQSEQECAQYLVQLSEDGTTFQDIREISCSGPSSTPQEYSCIIDYMPNWNWYYYARVKRSDINGSESYSQLAILNCMEGSIVDIFPTYITGNEVTILSDDRIVAVKMYAMDGRLVKNFDIAPDQKAVILDIGSITALGHYMLTVETPATRVDRIINVAH